MLGLGALMLMLLVGVLGGVVWAALDSVEAHQAPAPTPAPQPQPQPPPNPSPPRAPDVQDPLGTLITTVVGGVGEGMAGPTNDRQIQGNAATGVDLYEPQVIGQIDTAAIRQALVAAQPAMARCRRAGQFVRVRVQVHINLNQVLIAAPATSNSGPQEIARCCADAFTESVPAGWSPGTSGMVFFDVSLRPL
jgi:hypothetical protein